MREEQKIQNAMERIKELQLNANMGLMLMIPANNQNQ